MLAEVQEFADKHLEAFKLKMRISHDGEDDNLKRILGSSCLTIAKLVGASALDDTLVELTFERAMCDYNDALDEFQKLYGEEIEDLYLTNLIMAQKEADHVETEAIQA